MGRGRATAQKTRCSSPVKISPPPRFGYNNFPVRTRPVCVFSRGDIIIIIFFSFSYETTTPSPSVPAAAAVYSPRGHYRHKGRSTFHSLSLSPSGLQRAVCIRANRLAKTITAKPRRVRSQRDTSTVDLYSVYKSVTLHSICGVTSTCTS